MVRIQAPIVLDNDTSSALIPLLTDYLYLTVIPVNAEIRTNVAAYMLVIVTIATHYLKGAH